MSKFETDKFLPYEKLTRNLEVVKKRYEGYLKFYFGNIICNQ